jgi:hypothetical protein
MIWTRISLFLIFLFSAFLLAPAVHGDMIVPRLSYDYFDKDGHPYNGSVNYTITCFGYEIYLDKSRPPVSNQSHPIYGYTENYSGYGSVSYRQSYLQWTHIDWCDLEGTAESRNFTIKNISLISRFDYVMQRVPRDFGGIRKYYYVTPEYDSCTKFEQKTAAQWTAYVSNFSRVNTTNWTWVLQLPGKDKLYWISPSHKISINRSGLDMTLERYIIYLETCDANIDSACPEWLADGKPLKSFSEYRTLQQNTTHTKEHPCDTFLLDADPALILPVTGTYLLDHPCIDDDGNNVPCNLTGMIVESRFTIPSNIDLGNKGIKSNLLLPNFRRDANVHRSPVESLYCTVLSWFKMSCEET